VGSGNTATTTSGGTSTQASGAGKVATVNSNAATSAAIQQLLSQLQTGT